MNKTPSTTLRAGAGRAPIELPDDLFPTEGFTGVNDTLQARVLLLKGDASTAIVSLEMTSLPDERVASMQGTVAEAAGLPPENVWICVTHTLSAPHFVPKLLRKTRADDTKNSLLEKAVDAALREAAKQAAARLQAARLGAGVGFCDVNINRDVLTDEGWWLGRSDNGVSDKTLTVLRCEALDGSPLGLLFSHPVRPAVMERAPGPQEGRLVTSDLAGVASAVVERELGDGAAALFCMGAAGDQAPSVASEEDEREGGGTEGAEEDGQKGYALAEKIGKDLGACVLRLSEKIACVEDPFPIVVGRATLGFAGQEPVSSDEVRPTKKHEFTPGPQRSEPVGLITLGDVALVGVRPELNSATGVTIREKSPFPITLLLTMVNGGAKYMPDSDSYDRVTYESMASPFARGSAESLVREVVEFLSHARK